MRRAALEDCDAVDLHVEKLLLLFSVSHDKNGTLSCFLLIFRALFFHDKRRKAHLADSWCITLLELED